MSMVPTCGAQQPGTVPQPFDWWLFGGIAGGAGAAAWVYGHGVPLANQLIQLLSGSAPLIPGVGITAAAAGAAAVIILVAYYLFKADGCIVSPPHGEPVCFAGIVQDVQDLNSTAVNILAPFAIGPEASFDVVVKSKYWNLATKNAFWVFCSPAPAASAELPCFVKSATSCGARIGSAAGAIVGGVAGIVAGYLAGAAIVALACGPFAFLCFILALLVAAIVAAAITYGGAVIGGLIGEGIASVGSDTLGAKAKSLTPGAMVTVKGNWIQDPNVGNNELFYVTDICRNGIFANPPPFSTMDADSMMVPDDCPVVISIQ
jgi:hypothetical protein